jgi:hypothetical protein
MWSHNENTFPSWFSRLEQGINIQGFLYWDVGWGVGESRINDLTLPLRGYIWRSALKTSRAITHRVVIQRLETSHQPDKRLAKEAEENFKKLKIFHHHDDPLSKYLRSEIKTLTLMKISKIEELSNPLGLEDFRLWNGNPITKPPQGRYYIILP